MRKELLSVNVQISFWNIISPEKKIPDDVFMSLLNGSGSKIKKLILTGNVKGFMYIGIYHGKFELV